MDLQQIAQPLEQDEAETADAEIMKTQCKSMQEKKSIFKMRRYSCEGRRLVLLLHETDGRKEERTEKERLETLEKTAGLG